MTVSAKPVVEGAPAASNAPASVCPYCGHTGSREARCPECKGYLDPLSQQATQNMMGPWQVRDPRRAHHPGISYDKLRELAVRGRIGPDTVVRGPSTRQFWMFARQAPGVANLIGACHNCAARVNPDDYLCVSCGVVLTPAHDRQSLGLAPVQLLPGDAPAEALAASAVARASVRPAAPMATPAAAPPYPAAMWAGATQPALANTPAPAPAPGATARFVNDGAPVMAAAIQQEAEPHPVLAGALRDAHRRRAHNARVRALVMLGGLLLVGGAGYVAAQQLGLLNGASERDAVAGGDAEAPPVLHSSEQPVPPSTESPTGEGQSQPVSANGAGDASNAEAIDPDDAGLDAALAPWIESYRRAYELEKTGEKADLEEAIQILEEILAQARASEAGISSTPRRYPLLEDRLERLRARLDEMKLKELL